MDSEAEVKPDDTADDGKPEDDRSVNDTAEEETLTRLEDSNELTLKASLEASLEISVEVTSELSA